METKFTFDKNGVEAFNDYIYSLPTTEFLVSLSLLQTSFVEWVTHYFTLDEDQEEFLSELPLSFQQQSQSLLLLALGQGLPISLHKEKKDDIATKNPRPGVGKMIGIDFGSNASDTPANPLRSTETETGHLHFKVWYEKEE